MKFRAKIAVFDRPTDFDRPLALSFKNLAEDNPGEQVRDPLLRDPL
jgi:tRNA G10  N-methylase Trm11